MYYTPVLIPGVVGGLLWNDITNEYNGIFNIILNAVGLKSYSFYAVSETVLPTLLFMSLFGLGGNMILWIAQIKAIPEQLYEAARIEGAGPLARTLRITVPMCTPMIFYTLIMGVIGSFQIFSGVYVLLTPRNADGLKFYVVYTYEVFRNSNIGFASALSWILFVIIAAMAFMVFRTSKWVFYGETI